MQLFQHGCISKSKKFDLSRVKWIEKHESLNIFNRKSNIE